MPTGNCTVRIQNNTNALITFVDTDVTNGVWNQQPPATVAAGATSGNFDELQLRGACRLAVRMHYSIPNETTPFTAAAIIDQPQGGAVTCTPSGAGPGQHQVTFNVGGAAPNFTVLFTFNLKAAESHDWSMRIMSRQRIWSECRGLFTQAARLGMRRAS